MRTKLLMITCLILLGAMDSVAQKNFTYKLREKDDKIQILQLGGGHYHDDLSNAAILRNYLENELGYYITYSEDFGSVGRLGNESDVILIHSMLYDVSEKEMEALLKLVKAGKPLVAIHATSASFYLEFGHPAFFEMIGGKFKEHPPFGSFEVRIVDPDHPITSGVDHLSVEDELFRHVDLDPDMHVLMEADDEGEIRPMAWTKTYGKGKIFYLAIGHNEKTNRDPGFQTLVKNGIVWALAE